MQVQQQQATPVPAILTPQEVAEMLRVDLSWVYEKSRKRQRNPLPCHNIGRYLRFNRDEVLAWFDAQLRTPRKAANR